jgi:hypothetical protein
VFEASSHARILWADAVCVCDGQTGPTRRKERDEWGTRGTPGYLSIYSEGMTGPPANVGERPDYQTNVTVPLAPVVLLWELKTWKESGATT